MAERTLIAAGLLAAVLATPCVLAQPPSFLEGLRGEGSRKLTSVESEVVSVYVKGRKIDRESLQLARQGDAGCEPISPVDF